MTAIQEIVDTSLDPESGLPFDAWRDGRCCTEGWWFEGMPSPGHSGSFVLSEETGAEIDDDSLGSSWCLTAAAALRTATDRTDGFDALLRSEAHYDRHVARMECYGASSTATRPWTPRALSDT